VDPASPAKPGAGKAGTAKPKAPVPGSGGC
jgi:hypothetical protein